MIQVHGDHTGYGILDDRWFEGYREVAEVYNLRNAF